MEIDCRKKTGVWKENRIEKVEFKILQGRYSRRLGKNAVKGEHGTGSKILITKITTAEGTCGWGAATCIYDENEIIIKEKKINGMLLGDIFDPEYGILSQEYQIYDLALHDLAGRIMGIPVCRMLNPEAEYKANIYDGAVYMNDLLPGKWRDGVDEILKNCASDYAFGYRDFKVKIGRGYKWKDKAEGFQRDVEIVKAIHEKYPQARIMVDANDGYTLEEAKRFIEEIKPVHLYWMEEPFPEKEKDCELLKDFMERETPGTLLADGENTPDIPFLIKLAGKGSVDVFLPDIVSYGFTEWRKLLGRMKKTKILCSPHAWGDVVKTYYCAHLAAAFPEQISMVEGVPENMEGVDTSGYHLSEGVLQIPEKAGFGMELTGKEGRIEQDGSIRIRKTII